MTEKLQLPWEEARFRLPGPMKALYWILGIAAVIVALANQCGGGI